MQTIEQWAFTTTWFDGSSACPWSGSFRGALCAVQPPSMKLETHEGVFADPATIEDVARAVAGLTAVGEAYIILADPSADETYLQAAGTIGEDFIVERRDGCAGEHYRGDRRVSADELIAMLVGYLNGTTDWSHVVAWHRVRVDYGAANANA